MANFCKFSEICRKFSISVSQYLHKNLQDPEEQPWDITAIGEYFVTRAWAFMYISSHHHSTDTENNNFTNLLVAYFVLFSQRRPSLIPGFLDYTRLCNMQNYNSYPCWAPVLVPVHEQPYCAKAHLFKPGHSQENAPFLSTVWSAHTSQTNYTLGVKHAWAQYRLPSVSAP